jgi:hypothetical protein
MRRDTRNPLIILGLAVILLEAGAEGAAAQPCAVPSAAHPTVQSAVDDPGCGEVALAAQTYAESVTIGRSLTLVGVSSENTVIQGQVKVTAGTAVVQHVRVETDPLDLRGRFAQALLVETGGRLAGLDLVVLHRALLFGDGFETATTAGWTAIVP